MLSNLSHTDPKRERHLRSILLAISPEEQRRIAYERADDIADEVFYLLGELVREDQQEPFEHDIKKLCRLAVDSWETPAAAQRKSRAVYRDGRRIRRNTGSLQSWTVGARPRSHRRTG